MNKLFFIMIVICLGFSVYLYKKQPKKEVIFDSIEEYFHKDDVEIYFEVKDDLKELIKVFDKEPKKARDILARVVEVWGLEMPPKTELN